MNIRKNQYGFSIVEAMVAALILSISVVGVFATLSSQKAPAAAADKRVLAALAAKQFLEDLRSKVNAVDYNNNTGPLALGPGGIPQAYGPITWGGLYTINYTVSAAGNARKVDLSISW